MKKLTSFILMLTLVLCLFPVSTKAQADTKYTVTVTKDYDKAYAMLNLVNRERTANGLAPLAMDKDLLEAAMIRAAETIILFEHDRPDGSECHTVSPKLVGENIGWAGGYPDLLSTIHEGLMNSPGHRANILRPVFTTVGIGFVTFSDPVYGTSAYAAQCFGTGSAASFAKPAKVNQTFIINVNENFVLNNGGSFKNAKKYQAPAPAPSPVPTVQNMEEIQKANRLLSKGYAIRLFESKGKSGDHVYTTDFNEIIDLINKGWSHETEEDGSNTFKASPVKTAEYPTPVYCVIHKSGFHLYTLDESEVRFHLNSGKGWKAVNNGNPLFFCSNSKGDGIYRAFNPRNTVAPQQHFCRYNEYKHLINNGWIGNNDDKPYWYSNM